MPRTLEIVCCRTVPKDSAGDEVEDPSVEYVGVVNASTIDEDLSASMEGVSTTVSLVGELLCPTNKPAASPPPTSKGSTPSAIDHSFLDGGLCT